MTAYPSCSRRAVQRLTSRTATTPTLARDGSSTSRKPATLSRIIRDAEADPDNPKWRAKVRHLPPLDEAPLRPAQITAINGIEKSLADQHFDRSLVQMATGAGKTFTAVTEAYRLLRFGGFRRILFHVDRNNLAEQTIAEFQNYRTPGDGRRFTELYNAGKLTSAGMLGSSDVVVSTVVNRRSPSTRFRAVSMPSWRHNPSSR